MDDVRLWLVCAPDGSSNLEVYIVPPAVKFQARKMKVFSQRVG